MVGGGDIINRGVKKGLDSREEESMGEASRGRDHGGASGGGHSGTGGLPIPDDTKVLKVPNGALKSVDQGTARGAKAQGEVSWQETKAKLEG